MDHKSLPPALVVGEIGLVRSLGEAGIPVYVGSHYDDNVALFSRYSLRNIRFSHPSSDAFVDELIALGETEKRKMVFFSDDDRAVLTFSAHRERLAPYYLFNLPLHTTVQAILDKREFAELADKLELPVPFSFVPKSRSELENRAPSLPYPCVIKPARKEDWWKPEFLRYVGPYQKAITCTSKERLLEFYDKVVRVSPELVVQEFISGADKYFFSANLYLDASQKLLAYFIGHKLRIHPIHAGAGTLVESADDENLKNCAVDAARKLGLNGHVNIQFKQDPDTGTYKIMEIHARNSAWCYLSTGAGRNISAIAYFDILGLKNPLTDRYQTGVKWLDLNRDFKAMRDYRKTGEITFGQWLKSLRGKRVHHIYSATDVRPGIMTLWFILKRELKRKEPDGAAPAA